MFDPSFDYNDAGYRQACRDWGIVAMRGMSFDAQPQTVTTPNNGIPAWMLNFTDPDVLKIMFAPLKAATILGDGERGERRIGNMATRTATFPVVEHTGEVSSYGDFNESGSSGMNPQFPQRQSYNFQTMVQYGALETETMAEADINLVGEKKAAATWVIAKFLNKSYFYGIAGLQNYGLLNDPVLPAAIQPGAKAYGSQSHGPWITGGIVTATPNEIYTDIIALFTALVTQTQGRVEIGQDDKIVVAMHPTSLTALTQANTFGVSAYDLLKKHFPNIRFETAVQYNTTGGYLMQMWVEELEGQRVGFCAFSEKLRAFPIIQGHSSQSQKIAAGTFGAVIRQGYLCAQMLGL
jgi:hypothetical protein